VRRETTAIRFITHRSGRAGSGAYARVWQRVILASNLLAGRDRSRPSRERMCAGRTEGNVAGADLAVSTFWSIVIYP
jgi:hypothetical protein